MFPKVTNGRVDQRLTNVLLAYKNPSYIADRILPTVPGLKDNTGLIPEMGTAHMRVYQTKRALYDESEHRINFTINDDKTYRIDYYDLDSYVPDRLRDQFRAPFNAYNAAQMTVLEALKLERENALATALTSTTILSNNTTLSASTDKYTDTVNSDPETDFDTARDSIQGLTGYEANAVYMSRAVVNALRRHPFFLEIAQSSLKGGASKTDALSVNAFVETMKSWYELEDVIIGKTIKVTSKEGQTETKGAVWGNDVVFFYRPSTPSLFAPSLGYSFQLLGQNMRTVIRRHKNDKGDLVEAAWAYQDNILDPNCAYLLKSVI